MKGAMVLAVSTRALLDACGQLGLDTNAMLKAVGLDPTAIGDADARIPGEKVQALWQEAYRRSDDPNLALHAVEALPFGAYKVIDFLASSSTSIGDGLTKIARYFPLINSAIELCIAIEREQVTFRVTTPRTPDRVPRAYAEYTLAAVFLRARLGYGKPFALRRVEFAYASPSDISEHERVFECPVYFGAEHTQLCVERRVWDTPVASGNAGLSAVLEQHAAMLLQALPGSSGILGQVREAINRELRAGDPSQEHVARTLGMSGRTLQRRLTEQGQTYSEIVDEMRASAAEVYLDQGVSLAEVAYLLGFSGHSSFSRAFKRWTGATPGEYRQGAGSQSL